jgi:hypothetical protein
MANNLLRVCVVVLFVAIHAAALTSRVNVDNALVLGVPEARISSGLDDALEARTHALN